MVLLRLLTVLIFSSLLSGCYVVGKDYNSLKSDISAFKAYLRATPSPADCQAPGIPQARVCYYRLKVEPFEGGAKGLFKGHVPMSVVTDGAASCKDVQQKHSDTDFYCPDPANYRYVWYGFKVRDESFDPKKDVEYHFISEPYTNYLRIGKPDEASIEKP